ncbi:MAG: hypothetical protein MHPSP_004301 [Paramarteilia canceri]
MVSVRNRIGASLWSLHYSLLGSKQGRIRFIGTLLGSFIVFNYVAQFKYISSEKFLDTGELVDEDDL